MAPPMRVNNTGRIVFNKEAAERLERLNRPTPLKVIIDGDIIRLLSRTTDEASVNVLEVTYDKGAPYISEAQVLPLLEPLGFQGGQKVAHRTKSTLSTSTTASSSGSRPRSRVTRSPNFADDAR